MSLQNLKEEVLKDLVYIIIDTSIEDSLYEKIKPIKLKRCLYKTPSYLEFADGGPWLLKIDNSLDWLIEESFGQDWGIFLKSDVDIDILAEHFKQFETITFQEQETLFRYFSPHILKTWLMFCDPQMKSNFFGPVNEFIFESVSNNKISVIHIEKDKNLPKPKLTNNITFNKDHLKAFGYISTSAKIADQVKKFIEKGFKSEQEKNFISLTDKTGAKTYLTPNNLSLKILTPLKHQLKYTYDDFGRIKEFNDAAKNVLKITYDENDNATKIRFNEKNTTIKYTDSDDLRQSFIEIKYPDNTNCKLTSKHEDKLIEFKDGEGNINKFEHEYMDGLITKHIDANKNETLFKYKNFQIPSTIIWPDGKKYKFEYNENFFKQGLITSFSVNNQKIANYDIDPAKGIFKTKYDDGNFVNIETASTNIKKIKNNNCTIKYDFNEDWDIIQETCIQSKNNRHWSINYGRNSIGEVTTLHEARRFLIKFERDLHGRITSIDDEIFGTFKIKYSLNGAINKIIYPNNTVQIRQTNPEGFVESITTKNKKNILIHKTFERDICNRVISEKSENKITKLSYDKAGKLVEVIYPSRKENFTNDPNGNHINNYTFNKLNQIVDTPFEYDNLGHLIRGITSTGVCQLKYNKAGHMITSHTKNGETTYTYDGSGRRLEKHKNDGTIVQYKWAGDTLLSESLLDPGNNVIKERQYLFLPETSIPLAMSNENQLFFFHHGQRFETLSLTNNDGQIAWSGHYTAFGKTKNTHIFQPFHLLGQYYDEETGLNYSLNRYYNSHTGTYLSCDPMYFQGKTFNFYSYCNGDPINYVDPKAAAPSNNNQGGNSTGSNTQDALSPSNQASANLEGKQNPHPIPHNSPVSTFKPGKLGQRSVYEAKQFAAFAPKFLDALKEYSNDTCKSNDELKKTTSAVSDAISSIEFKKENPALKCKNRKTEPVKPTDWHPSKLPGRAGKGSICPTCVKIGEPVHGLTGEMFVYQTDFTTPGRMPLEWTRAYKSQSNYNGVCGYKWHTVADIRLEKDDEKIIFYNEEGDKSIFDSFPIDEYPIIDPGTGFELAFDESETYEGNSITVWDPDEDKIYKFAKDTEFETSPLIQICDRNGNVIKFEKDDNGLSNIRIGRNGRRINVRSARGLIQEMTYMPTFGEKIELVRYVYKNSDLIEIYDQAKQKRSCTYDNLSHMLSHTDRNGLKFNYKYEVTSPFRCIHTWCDSGLYDNKLEYGDNYTKVTTAADATTTYEFDKNFLLTKQIDSEGNVTQFEYDQNGRATAVIDPENNRTEYIYSDYKKIETITRPDEKIIDFEYNEFAKPVKITDPNENVWTQKWNKSSLIEQTTPNEDTTKYLYNDRGDIQKITDPLGNETLFSTDKIGNIIQITDAENNTTKYKFDNFSNLLEVIDPIGEITQYKWDIKNQLSKIIKPLGSSIECSYDGESNLVKYIDENKNITSFKYTGMGLVSERKNPDGTQIKYSYDNEANLISLLNENGQRINFTRDSNGKILSEKDYWGALRKYEYSPAGNLTKAINPDGNFSNFTYNNLGQLIQIVFSNEKKEKYEFDFNGNLTLHENEDVIVERRFDAQNRLTREKINDFIVDNTYDANGQRTKRKTLKNIVTYEYNKVGDATAVIVNNKTIKINRDARGFNKSEIFGTHIRKYTRNEEGFLTKQVFNHDYKTTGTREYSYDPAGNLLHIKGESSTYFTYDPMGRLTSFVSPEMSLKTILHDPAGNLFRQKTSTKNDYRIETTNNLDYIYDVNGNLVKREHKNGGFDEFEWENGNLKKFKGCVINNTVSMIYDCQSRRIEKITNGAKTTFGWDGNALLAEEGQHSREFIYYPDTFEPLAMINNEELLLYQNDQSGTPCEMVAENGDIVWSISYGPFAEVAKIHEQKIWNPIRMQGQYDDGITGLYYNRYRYYDPKIGAFISQDPIGLEGDVNLYNFAPNCQMWIDPLGLCSNEPIHGNSKLSKKTNHVYEIIDTETGDVFKYGISSGKIRLDDKSYRAEAQVRKLNRKFGTNRFKSRTVTKGVTRQKALNIEQGRVNAYSKSRQRSGLATESEAPIGNLRPRPQQ